jgi:hypothetical protein
MAGFVSLTEFDFAVRLPTHTVTVKAGQPVTVPIMVETLKGTSRTITLTASDWQSMGLTAAIAPPTVESGTITQLQVTVPPGTPPGSYLFTVRGDAAGTFKTSNDTLTVIVSPDAEQKGEDSGDGGADRADPGTGGGPAVAAPPVRGKRAVFGGVAKKAPARPMSPGQRALMLVAMFILVGVLIYAFVNIFSGLSGGSLGGGGGATAGTYTGTSTFCINSVMGNTPECGTSSCSLQIDAAGNVSTPGTTGGGLTGKITGSSFSGTASANGSTFPMTGTFSNGTLTAEYESSSVTWTIRVSK